jgi:hypothetical protein
MGIYGLLLGFKYGWHGLLLDPWIIVVDMAYYEDWD